MTACLVLNSPRHDKINVVSLLLSVLAAPLAVVRGPLGPRVLLASGFSARHIPDQGFALLQPHMLPCVGVCWLCFLCRLSLLEQLLRGRLAAEELQKHLRQAFPTDAVEEQLREFADAAWEALGPTTLQVCGSECV